MTLCSCLLLTAGCSLTGTRVEPQRATVVAGKTSADLVLTRDGNFESIQFILPEGALPVGELRVILEPTMDGLRHKITVYDESALGLSDFDNWDN